MTAKSRSNDRQAAADAPPLQPGLPLSELVAQAERWFSDRFGRAPRWITAAPGRVNLIGEHVDYNDGFVLPMAIERYVVLAGGPSHDGRLPDGRPGTRVYSAALQETVVGPADQSDPPASQWSSYVQGTLAECLRRGMDAGPLDLAVVSNVPLGGGLSSSAALEVATATLVEAAVGRRLAPVEKALLCQSAEHKYAGVPCGIMDQFSSVMGERDHLMLLDCRSQQLAMVPLSDPHVTVLIINTNVKHELSGGEYAERRRQCEVAAEALQVASLRDADLGQLESRQADFPPIHYRRARHVISEIERTRRAAEALAAGDWRTVGSLMYASHESLRDDYEVSCEELNLLVEFAREIGDSGGVIGSRMTGGGFGGCTVSLVATDAVTQIARRVHDQYLEQTGIRPTGFTTRPAAGAHVVRAQGG